MYIVRKIWPKGAKFYFLQIFALTTVTHFAVWSKPIDKKIAFMLGKYLLRVYILKQSPTNII